MRLLSRVLSHPGSAFVGRRHFDDADMIERRFELDLGTGK
jgi:hypothetical protein